jgi:hypothetical protein
VLLSVLVVAAVEAPLPPLDLLPEGHGALDQRPLDPPAGLEVARVVVQQLAFALHRAVQPLALLDVAVAVVEHPHPVLLPALPLAGVLRDHRVGLVVGLGPTLVLFVEVGPLAVLDPILVQFPVVRLLDLVGGVAVGVPLHIPRQVCVLVPRVFVRPARRVLCEEFLHAQVLVAVVGLRAVGCHLQTTVVEIVALFLARVRPALEVALRLAVHEHPRLLQPVACGAQRDAVSTA